MVGPSHFLSWHTKQQNIQFPQFMMYRNKCDYYCNFKWTGFCIENAYFTTHTMAKYDILFINSIKPKYSNSWNFKLLARKFKHLIFEKNRIFGQKFGFFPSVLNSPFRVKKKKSNNHEIVIKRNSDTLSCSIVWKLRCLNFLTFYRIKETIKTVSLRPLKRCDSHLQV